MFTRQCVRRSSLGKLGGLMGLRKVKRGSLRLATGFSFFVPKKLDQDDMKELEEVRFSP